MNDMSKPAIEELPPDHKPGPNSYVAAVGVEYNSTVEQGIYVMVDLIALMRQQIAEEDKRGDADIELPVVEGFCNKLDFVIDSLEHSQKFYRDFFRHHGKVEKNA
jgi:hypothetical protein